ncbi:MAG TPA: hypothetical protein VHE12_09260 [bacterium]|nr:hypothetical protein [bacterium]
MDPITIRCLDASGLPQDIPFVRMEGMLKIPIGIEKTESAPK